MLSKQQNRIENIVRIFPGLVGAALFFYLTWQSLCGTWLFELSYTLEQYTVKDSILRHLLAAAGMVCLAFILYGLMRRLSGKDEKKAKLFCTVLEIAAALFVFSLALYWVRVSGISPFSDQGDIILAVEDIRNGRWEVFRPDGYLGKVRYQMGVAAVFEAIMSVTGSATYQVIEYVNAFCLPLLLIILFQMLRLLYDSRLTEILYLAFMVSCVPLYIFTTLIYGEILSLTACVGAAICVVCYLKTGKHALPVLCASCLLSAVGILCRVNGWIFVIALCILLAVYGVKNRRRFCFVLILCLTLSPLLANWAVKVRYERLAGFAIDQGFPVEAGIAMGMMDGGRWSNGWYNGYNFHTYEELGYNREALAEDARREIRERLAAFSEGRKDWAAFYEEKILSQWNDPSYCAFASTYHFSEETPEWAERVYDNGYLQGKIAAFENEHQFLVYVGALLACLFAITSRKEAFAHHIFLIVIIGGFLFSVIWEASSRYVFPYYICMLPWAAYGWGKCIEAGAGKVRNRKKASKGS